ncbi:uncharacterized protein [Atheta coriaria]|uniref:uncharacterized protein n=1 Tax=Dalotia coriaria TaxID=877792 RepID=UPI0031F4577D
MNGCVRALINFSYHPCMRGMNARNLNILSSHNYPLCTAWTADEQKCFTYISAMQSWIPVRWWRNAMLNVSVGGDTCMRVIHACKRSSRKFANAIRGETRSHRNSAPWEPDRTRIPEGCRHTGRILRGFAPEPDFVEEPFFHQIGFCT